MFYFNIIFLFKLFKLSFLIIILIIKCLYFF